MIISPALLADVDVAPPVFFFVHQLSVDNLQELHSPVVCQHHTSHSLAVLACLKMCTLHNSIPLVWVVVVVVVVAKYCAGCQPAFFVSVHVQFDQTQLVVVVLQPAYAFEVPDAQ